MPAFGRRRVVPEPWNPLLAQESKGDLQAAAQNPIADLISLPLQNNTGFGVGPSAPIITANWEASNGDEWTVPVGVVVGKIAGIGKQPINTQISTYYNVEHPDAAPDWSLRLQVQFLFPK